MCRAAESVTQLIDQSAIGIAVKKDLEVLALEYLRKYRYEGILRRLGVLAPTARSYRPDHQRALVLLEFCGVSYHQDSLSLKS